MEKEADTALRWEASLGSGGDPGNPVKATECALPESPSNLEPLSPTEKARQLPLKMWMIVAAACLSWAIVIAVGYWILL